MRELWDEGFAFVELRRRQEEIVTEKEELDRDKKAFVKRCKAHANGGSGTHQVRLPVMALFPKSSR